MKRVPGWAAGLTSYLSELGLPIGSQVFVTEAARELIVTSDAAGHEELLVLLWALRQCICHACAPAGDEEFACTLGGRLEQQWGLYLKKPWEASSRLRNVVATLAREQSCAQGLREPNLQVA